MFLIGFLRFFCIAIFIILSSILMICVSLLRPRNINNNYIAIIMYRSIAYLLGIKIEVLGKENIPDTGCIFIANHQSNYDIFLVTNAVPKKTIAIGKKSILYFPFFGLIYWLGGNVLIDRNNREAALNVLSSLEKRMKKENIFVWFFPEGSRNYGKKLLPFKKGAFYMAKNLDCPVIPVCVSTYYTSFNINRINNGKIIIKYLSPENVYEPLKSCVYDIRHKMENEIFDLDKSLDQK